ncbi:Tol-Pal system beta propeller repeat protein TolB [hydrothermal vent metagenome]|uniref:Tol-Pal system beta propeller repeat protein TolB n=1 Tax=hydrothermal vent metagenome TaxID=652676 RepID=A0A3B0YBF2_9ZZZZ
MKNISNKLLALCITLLSVSSFAEPLELTIIGGSYNEGIPVAVVPFKVVGGDSPGKISKVIYDDLKLTGKFKMFTASDFPEQPSSAAELNVKAWRAKKIENVVVGQISKGPKGYTIKMELINVYGKIGDTSGSSGKKLAETTKIVIKANLRLKAHQISNLIYKALTGIDGVFDTRIAYIRASKNKRGKRHYQLIVADADGHNAKVIRNSANPMLSLSWSPNGKQLAYVAYRSNGRTAIYIQTIATNKRRLISSFKGINGAPRFSADGSRLALTLSKYGNPEICTFDLRTRRLKRLTFNTAIDTEPSWSPNGRNIIFTSDRSGRQQLYRVSANGGRAVRITHRGRSSARGIYSPNGKQIAMEHNSGSGKFSIGLKAVGSSNITVLTDGRLDESPSFAANGQMLIFASEYNRRGVLTLVSIDGKAKFRLKQQSGDIREAVWGPKRR